MTVIVATGRGCGADFEPTKQDVLRGVWRTCPACRPPSAPPSGDSGGRCEQCGRVLRNTTRTVCLSCLTGGAVL